MMEANAKPLLSQPAKAVSTLVGGVGILFAWRLAWVFLLWHLSGLHPSLTSFTAYRQELEAWDAANPTQVWAFFLLAYTLICALCLDGTATLVVVAGALFGTWKGLALCTAGSSLGALAAFAFARRFLGAWMRMNFPRTVGIVDRGLKQDGDAWLLSARLIPMVSYSLVNLVLGVSTMKPRRFLALSTLGLLPCNAAYVWAGVHLARVHASGDLLSPGLWASLCVVGLLPLALRLVLRWKKRGAALLVLGLLILSLPLNAAFSLSRALVADDPGLPQGSFSKAWPHINIQEARRLLKRDGVLFLDSRSQPAWMHAHIPGSLSLPEAEFHKRYPALRLRLLRAKVLVCYCQGPACATADALAQMLADEGLRTLAVFPGGLPQWKTARLPLEGQDIPEEKVQLYRLPGAN